LRVVAVEADPDTRERLRHNIEFSGAADNFTVVAAGVGAERGQGTIQTHDRNRGEHRVVPAAAGSPAAGRGKTVPIEIIPLLDICRAEGVDRIDILKIDVEGFDYDVLRAFFATASRSLFPGMIIVEAGRDQGTSPVVELVQTNGYRLAERTRLNAILVAPDQSDKQG
jgi:FkbM family methyltransferase